MVDSDALRIEKAIVSKRFYEDYKKAFENAKPIIAENTSITDANEIHQTTQTLFNKILFLRFIEKKGWLHFGETDDYLRELFKAGGVGSSTFYSSRLKRLFLEGLAIEGKQNESAYGEVPFLNAGLFEESEFDKAIRDLPDEMFEPLLGDDGLFYKYNFTVQESTPLDIDVAIDPEMIGTMFEELVTDRGGKGAFYTPRVVVAYMCREAIKSVLEERTEVNAESIRKLVDDNDIEGLSIDDARTINTVLVEVKAIDPACGSGAYLLGLLHELVRVHSKLSTTAEELTESRHKMKLRIISRSIYGVDLDPFATNIAMLRLWLSLLVEAPEPLPLPNLDFNIETGDALLAPDPSPGRIDDVTGAIDQANTLALKKEVYLEAIGDNARELRAEIKAEEAEIRKLLRKQDDEIGSVDFRVHFASVFTKNGGFDIVLANPPYIRQEEIEKKSKAKMLALYGGGENPPVVGKSDLYCYFYVRANQLLRPRGIQIFICSNTWLDVAFGYPLQHYFLKTSRVVEILDSKIERQFASADINTIISTIIKAKPSSDSSTSFVLLNDGFSKSIRDSSLRTSTQVTSKQLIEDGTTINEHYEGNRWNLYLRAPRIYFRLLSLPFIIRLREISTIRRGITSGINSFFYLSKENIDRFNIEAEFMGPLLKSPSQCKTYRIDTSDSDFMVFICNKNKRQLVGTKALEYIKWGESQVTKGRQKQSSGIAWPDTSSVRNRRRWYSIDSKTRADFFCNRFFHDRYFYAFGEDLIDDQTFYGGKYHPSIENPLLQTALLNSSIGQFMTALNGRTGLGEGVLQYAVFEMERLPVIDSRTIGSGPAKNIVNLFQSIADSEILNVDKCFQDEGFLRFDDSVYDALGIDTNDRKLVRESVIEITNNRLRKAESV